jgi:hypothetical protein
MDFLGESAAKLEYERVFVQADLGQSDHVVRGVATRNLVLTALVTIDLRTRGLKITSPK